MKIAFIGQKGIPATQGGIETHVENLSYSLAERGHDIFVYSRKNYSQDETVVLPERISRIFTPYIKGKSFETISHTLFSTIHALFRRYDVIHYHGVGPAVLSFIPRIFKPSAKVIVTFHCRDRFHQKWGLFARMFLAFGEYAACKFPHETIAVSKILKNFCLEKYNTEALYIPNGCSVGGSYNSNVLEDFGIEKQKYILVVSRLVKHKGIHYLIDAFKRLNREDLKLVIVGDTSYTDEYLVQLKEMTAGDDRVVFTGLQKDDALSVLYKHALIFVQPSEAEGLPITVLEALRYGLPTIVSNIPENIEASGGYVYVFENKDVGSLTKMLSLVLSRITVARGMAGLGSRHIREVYDWKSIALSVEASYELRFNSLRPSFVGRIARGVASWMF